MHVYVAKVTAPLVVMDTIPLAGFVNTGHGAVNDHISSFTVSVVRFFICNFNILYAFRSISTEYWFRGMWGSRVQAGT